VHRFGTRLFTLNSVLGYLNNKQKIKENIKKCWCIKILRQLAENWIKKKNKEAHNIQITNKQAEEK